MKNISSYPWHQKLLSYTQRQIQEERYHHATLFRLRQGYNDAQLGWNIIQQLLCNGQDCKNNKNNQGTQLCKHCRLLQEQEHPNVQYLDAINDKVGIDDVRQLEQQMWQTSMFDVPKVAYIQGIDILSMAAQNALLKTLEEPPQNTYFILSVHNISRVLPTIISRVQRLHYGKVSRDDIILWLQSQLSPSEQITSAELIKVAKLVDFAPLTILSLLCSPTELSQLQQEKKMFSDFIAGKQKATYLAEQLDKEQPALQLARYCRYTEKIIQFLFDKYIEKNSEEKSSKLETDMRTSIGDRQVSVEYPTYCGVSVTKLYQLYDRLTDLQRLADTNVSLPLQLATSLEQWQQQH